MLNRFVGNLFGNTKYNECNFLYLRVPRTSSQFCATTDNCIGRKIRFYTQVISWQSTPSFASGAVYKRTAPLSLMLLSKCPIDDSFVNIDSSWLFMPFDFSMKCSDPTEYMIFTFSCSFTKGDYPNEVGYKSEEQENNCY